MLGIAFSLAASACWGTADFVGGLFSRRLPVLVVLFTIETSGLLVLLVALAGSAPPLPGARAAIAAVVAGSAGIAALGAFYRALAIGTMSIVAPVSATGVALPVLVGIATGDALSFVVAVGIAVTVTGVILASREHPETQGGPPAAVARASLGLALLAALGFGTFFIAYDVASDSSVLWAAMLSRVVAVPAIGGLLLWQRPVRPHGRDLRLLAATGLVDAGAVGLYALANRHGDLSVVAVVGSLYPVFTVLLARAVLRERIRPIQGAGIATALVGVAMIAAG